jgi:hypothetical protein
MGQTQSEQQNLTADEVTTEINNVKKTTTTTTTKCPSQYQSQCQKHYSERKALLDRLTESVNFLSKRIMSLTKGPRCRKQPEIFNQEECQKLSGIWDTDVILPADNNPDNQPWLDQLASLQIHYLSTLKILLEITQSVRDFGDYETPISQANWADFRTDTELKLDKLETKFNNEYIKLTATPYAVYQSTHEAQQKEQARRTAIRMSYNVPV